MKAVMGNIYPLVAILLYFQISGIFQEAAGQLQITGFQVDIQDSDDPAITGLGRQLEDGSSIIQAGIEASIRFYGSNLQDGGLLWFTKQAAAYKESCALMGTSKKFVLVGDEINPNSATAKIKLDMLVPDTERYYLCVSESSNYTIDSNPKKIHQGNATWMRLATKEAYRKHYLLPLWLQIIVIVFLLMFSGLFSGLNLGLMSLDKTELDIMINSGTENEKKYAKKIRPLRKRGNFLLCTILLGNVMVNNTLAILLDDITGSGLAAIISATLAIVVFGEIIPQAVCSRYGLAVGAKTSWFTRFFMVVTFPLSYPISRVLDCVLGEEIGNVYNRDRLRELLRLTENEMDLVKDEMNIITGALQLSKKIVADVMTKLEDVFMIESDAVLDFDTMNLIMKTGYTRIPIYEKERKNIVGLLNIKDLAFVDPDDRTPLNTVVQFYKHPVNCVFDDTHLDVMLEEFKIGRSHLAMVQKVNPDGPGDPFYETIGLVTLEDIIEEIFQCEIVDETDTVYDNIKKAPRKSNNVKDFSIFNQPDKNNYIRLSPQLTLATFQFLSTSVEPFKPSYISDMVLQRLLRKNVIYNLRLVDPDAEECFLYRAGKQCDFFILILQGRVQVTFGKEMLVFEAGPFMYFGIQALLATPLSRSTQSLAHHLSQSSLTGGGSLEQNLHTPYVPDFTARAVTDLQYILIRRIHYIIARRSTEVERRQIKPGADVSTAGSPSDTTAASDQFDRDWTRTDQRLTDKANAAMVISNEAAACELDAMSPGLSESEPLNFTRSKLSSVNSDKEEEKLVKGSESGSKAGAGGTKAGASGNEDTPLIVSKSSKNDTIDDKNSANKDQIS